MSSCKAVLWIAVAVVIVAGVTIAYFAGLFSSDEIVPTTTTVDDISPDPRVTFDTPYRNVRPDVAYVGDVTCIPCHKDLCDSFHQHPMGRSAAFWADVAKVELFAPSAHTTFVAPTGVRYRVEAKDGKLWQTEESLDTAGRSVATATAEAAIVIGSGRQARSYLCVRDGSVWQTGISWYTGRQRWDLSPGFAPGHHAQRPIQETCFFCHVDRVEIVVGSEMRYREPLFARQAHIGCERCHGPGELHVRQRTDGVQVNGIDTSIVNPRHLEPALRDAVCQQCHLQGVHQVAHRGRSVFDFRPGLPLESIQSVFVKTDSGSRDLQFVGHVEQMAASRCGVASAGKLSCTSCHDPHRDPPDKKREEHYRQACLNCHADRGCSLPIAERQAKNDSCAACHMPRRTTADISHTAVSDHRIPRRAGVAPTDALKKADPELPIELFHAKSRYVPTEDERERDLGIALAYLVRVNRAQRMQDANLIEAAAIRLQQAIKRFPTDAVAWESLAVVLSAESNNAKSLAATERALAIQPREAALHHGAMLAMQLNDNDKAADMSRRAVELNPGNSLSRVLHGLALVERREWTAASADLRAGLRDMPTNTRARTALAVCLFHLGDKSGAIAELERATAIAPASTLTIREYYGRRAR